MNIAELLLSVNNVHNGHLQTEINGLTEQQVKDITKELNEFDPDSIFVIEWWPQGANIYQKDYWKTGEHNLGHTDRLILGVENILE